MHRFGEVWMVDFEFTAPPGHNPQPICLVAKELRADRTLRLWRHELEALPHAPFDTGPGTLYVAYYASAEMGCHLALGWPLPVNILDLFAEFRSHSNGLPLRCGAGLLGALAYFGLGAIEAAEKADMRELAMRGGPYTAEKRRHSSIIASPTLRAWSGSMRGCGRTLIWSALFFAAGIWRRQRKSSGMACPSIPECWSGCASIGGTFRMH